jgi:alkylation response protein AidB-like acyl-CoA dehydrogenase
MPDALNLTGIALTVTQGKWKRLAKSVAKNSLLPLAAQVDHDGSYPRESLKAIADAGLMGLLMPKQYGGPGEGILTYAMVLEELAQGCASTAMVYCMHMSTLPMIAALVQENQVEAFVKPIVEGRWIGALAMSEPGSGNRLWHMDSFAQRNGTGYLIDSFKSFCTSCGQADFYVVPVRADSTVAPTELSLFMIDGKDPNILPIGKWDGMGLRGNCSMPIHFKGCHVPELARLGSPTCGFSMLFAYSLPIYQVGLATCYLGIAQAAYDAAVEHVKKRVHSDTKMALSQVETVQRYIAEMKMRVDEARCMVYRVAQMSDNAMVLFNELHSADLLDEIIRENPDDPYFIELAQLKFAVNEIAVEVASKAFQVCGGTAYKRGHPVERHVRDARAGSVMAPSDDSLKLIVGRQILGIPQPWDGDARR